MSSSKKYERIPSSNIEDEGSEIRMEKVLRRKWGPAGFLSHCPWIICTIFFATLSLYLLTAAQMRPAAASSGAFNTDFAAAQPWVEYEERVSSGKLSYDPVKHKPYRDIDPTQPQYFGRPGPEMDALWEDLLRNEFTPMTAEEAAPFTLSLKPLPTDEQYHFEVDVLHSLHCLNSVRKMLYEYIYQLPREDGKVLTTDSDDWEHMHMDHCLDQLRQSIQFHGDLSPVPLYWWDGFGTALGQGSTHTCRKWEKIREWVDRRNLGLDETRL